MDQFQVKALLGALISSSIFFILIDLSVKKFSNKNHSRPSEITTLCILFILGAVWSMKSLSSGLNNQNLVKVINLILSLVWVVGFWKMKKWAVLGYIGAFLISQLMLILQGQWSLTVLVILMLPLIILFYFYPRMS